MTAERTGHDARRTTSHARESHRGRGEHLAGGNTPSSDAVRPQSSAAHHRGPARRQTLPASEQADDPEQVRRATVAVGESGPGGAETGGGGYQADRLAQGRTPSH